MEMQPTTSYGTASLASDQEDTLEAVAARRRNTIRWGAIVGTIGAGFALIIYGYTHHVPTVSITARSSGGNNGNPNIEVTGTQPMGVALEGFSLECWQSATIHGEKHMMESIEGIQWTKRDTGSSSFIKIDSSKRYQQIFGFGGAFTEAASLQFQKLPLDKQEEVLNLYFDKKHGSAYSFGRVPMGSCDFSQESYNFDDVENDTELIYFDTNVTQDTKLIIPFIHRALQKNPDLKLFLAPWSPPEWMKVPNPIQDNVPSMDGSAQPNGLNPLYRKSWALYFSKFITAYKNHNISFWGMTPQNEPEFPAPWEACVYNASYEADFIGDFLGPVLKRDHPEVKIMIFDHNRGSVAKWAETVYHHPTAKNYVDGMAFHWYDDERYMDGVKYHDHLNDTHFVDETRFMLATESCNCPGVATGKDAWFRAQRYAHDIITDINNWVVGWVDWNLILDHTGGPNHLGNECDAPIILDETNKDYYVQPMYYFIQHFSKFVPPGSRRIQVHNAAKFTSPGDAQLFTIYPVEMHTCDGSSRQHIIKTQDNKLQINGTDFCIDVVRPEWQGLQIELVKCIYTSQTWTFMNDQIRMHDDCLQLNHGSSEDGVRVTIGKCINSDNQDDDHQKWKLVHPGGRLQSLAPAAADLCVTAGYSFVQSVAFITPDNKKVAVVLNENTEETTFDLQYGEVSAEITLPPGGIRTLVWE